MKNTENMEMPCPCTCGQWFDLHDGYRTKRYNDNRVICEECHELEEKQERAIRDLEAEIDELEISDRKPKTREKLRLKLKKLEDELYY